MVYRLTVIPRYLLVRNSFPSASTQYLHQHLCNMISQSSSSPLFVVVGATGTQGRSVIKAIKESSKSYRVRTITRDPTSAAAQALKDIGCETFKADVDDTRSLQGGFEGASYAFLMTNSDYTDQTPDFKHVRSWPPLADDIRSPGLIIIV
jgi:hypothetical protein